MDEPDIKKLKEAAPEMYEALEDAVYQMKKVCSHCEQWVDWVQAEEALKKARGEA